MSLGFENCKVFISNVDSQSSAEGGIIVQVIGEMSNAGGPWRKFAQTFFLAEQPSGYYVLNDIFRYLKEEEDEAEEADPSIQSNPNAPPQQSNTLPPPMNQPSTLHMPPIPSSLPLQPPNLDPLPLQFDNRNTNEISSLPPNHLVPMPIGHNLLNDLPPTLSHSPPVEISNESSAPSHIEPLAPRINGWHEAEERAPTPDFVAPSHVNAPEPESEESLPEPESEVTHAEISVDTQVSESEISQNETSLPEPAHPIEPPALVTEPTAVVAPPEPTPAPQPPSKKTWATMAATSAIKPAMTPSGKLSCFV